MTEAFVVDASLALAWVLPSQASSAAEALLARIESGAVPVVPALWFLEVANGLLAAERRKLLTPAERHQALGQLSGMRFTVDDESGHAAFGRVSALADEHRLSVYDAVYLDVALRRALPLGSRDRALVAAARRRGVSILG